MHAVIHICPKQLLIITGWMFLPPKKYSSVVRSRLRKAKNIPIDADISNVTAYNEVDEILTSCVQRIDRKCLSLQCSKESFLAFGHSHYGPNNRYGRVTYTFFAWDNIFISNTRLRNTTESSSTNSLSTSSAP